MSNIVNRASYQSGEYYQSKLQAEINKLFPIILGYLGSYYTATADGALYTRSIKVMATLFAEIRIQLLDVLSDLDYEQTRTDFVEQTLGSMVFPSGSTDLGVSDSQFHEFYIKILNNYFKGATLPSVKSSLEALLNLDIQVLENLDSRFGTSDDFIFDINVLIKDTAKADVVLQDKNVSHLLSVVRPAHTLYRLKYLLFDQYTGNKSVDGDGKVFSDSAILDSSYWQFSGFSYDEVRKSWNGVLGVDDLGVKLKTRIIDEVVNF